MEHMGDGQLQWNVAERPCPGESQSGDGYLVAATTRGWLLAVVDGLGHGTKAATACLTCIEELERHKEGRLEELFRLCHKALKTTRGCACSIISIDRERNVLTWLGVGNVDGVVRRAPGVQPSAEYITMRSGIVGYTLPGLRSSSLMLANGDTLALATDGIRNDFPDLIVHGQEPDVQAKRILNHLANPADDALILVARYTLLSGQQEDILS